MTHDEIVQAVAALLWSEGHYQIVTECRPSIDSQGRADLVAFDRWSRRPELCVEVKPTLLTHAAVSAAVAQVGGYARWLLYESPRARLLPLVIAESVGPTLDARPWQGKALVWSLEMLTSLLTRPKGLPLGDQRDAFLGLYRHQAPMTHHPRQMVEIPS